MYLRSTDKVACMAGKKARNPLEIIWLAPSHGRDFANDILCKFIVVHKSLSHARCNPTKAVRMRILTQEPEEVKYTQL
jgi:hypothetical protein